MRVLDRPSHPVRVFAMTTVGVLAASIQPTPLVSQSCSPATVAEQIGRWVEQKPHVPMEAGVAPASRHPAILERIKAIAALFREAYPEPRGTEAEGQASIRSYADEIPDGPFQFGYTINIAALTCSARTGRRESVPDVNGWASVYANSLHRLVVEFGELPIDGRPVMVWELARRIGTFRDETLYEVKAGLVYGNAVVLARAGRLPWKTISRKQYLDALAIYLGRQSEEADSAMQEFLRRFEAQIAESKKTLTGEARDKVVAEMERALAEVRAQRPARIGDISRAVAKELEAIEKYRAAHSERELAQPAVMPQGTARTFIGEFGEESEGGHLLVVVDPTYFRKGAPAESIQLATLLWGADREVPALDAWYVAFERSFGVDRLRALLEP